MLLRFPDEGVRLQGARIQWVPVLCSDRSAEIRETTPPRSKKNKGFAGNKMDDWSDLTNRNILFLSQFLVPDKIYDADAHLVAPTFSSSNAHCLSRLVRI